MIKDQLGATSDVYVQCTMKFSSSHNQKVSLQKQSAVNYRNCLEIHIYHCNYI